jgi:two-component system CheB/CheR fusion protein
VELRAALKQAHEKRRVIRLGRVKSHAGTDDERAFEVEITPLFAAGSSEALGASITFADVTAHSRLDAQHREVARELETAYEELQSTVEELETTNEELQSTNEELEAMSTVQGERAGELDRLNMFLEGVLGNLGLAVVVLDADQRVQLWNGSATDLWGLRGEEVLGEHFLALDIGLPMDKLKAPIRQALSDSGRRTELSVEAVNRRGRHVRLQGADDTAARPRGTDLRRDRPPVRRG